jgi:UDP-glucuronate decarboxylase
MTGSRSKLTRRPLPIDDPVQRCPDITQATAVLGWQPKTDLKTGLARTIDYFDKLLTESRELEPAAPR